MSEKQGLYLYCLADFVVKNNDNFVKKINRISGCSEMGINVISGPIGHPSRVREPGGIVKGYAENSIIYIKLNSVS